MFCSKCGAQNPNEAIFCAACGQRLEQVENAAPEMPTQPVQEEAASGSLPQVEYNPYSQPQQAEYNPYSQPQQPEYVQAAPQDGSSKPIKDYLVGNIITTVFSFCCCSFIGMITGIIGIVFSSGVKSALLTGDMQSARSKSDTAKIMFFVTLGLLILGIIINVIFFALGMSDIYPDILDELSYYM